MPNTQQPMLLSPQDYQMAQGQPQQTPYTSELMSWIQANPQNPDFQRDLLGQYFGAMQQAPTNQQYELAGMYSQLAQAAVAAGDQALARKYLEQASSILGGGFATTSGPGGGGPVSPQDLGQYQTFRQASALGQSIGGISPEDLQKYASMERLEERRRYQPQWYELPLTAMSPIAGLGFGVKNLVNLAEGRYRPGEKVSRLEQEYSPQDIERYQQYKGLLGTGLTQTE